MEPQNKPYLPEQYWNNIEQWTQGTPRKENFLILFQENRNYVIWMSSELEENFFMPKIIHPSLKLAIKTHTFTQETKKSTLDNFNKCSNDFLNEIKNNFIVLAFQWIEIPDVTYHVCGYEYNGLECGSDQLETLMNQIKKDHESVGSRFITFAKSVKNKKREACCLMPFMHYIIRPILAPLKTEVKMGLITHSMHSVFVLSDVQAFPTALSLNQVVKQKVVTSSHQKNPSFLADYCLYSPEKIFNPHIYTVFESKEKYQLYLVRGMYEYYHYGDQGFSDHGWGCAYRAFQTLLSWMRFQGYSKNEKMLTIRQIQQLLDRMDRTRKLKGGSEWIGATEISWMIPKLTYRQIPCKILHLSDGQQILEKCEEFREHFEKVGCPIMYGGGEYAYSIVGMHYNWKFGECMFLILDPHYTGEDDYGKIWEKKGLSWRKPEQMFKKGVFYNFCLPLIKQH